MTIGLIVCICGIGIFAVGFIMTIVEIIMEPSRKKDIMEKMKKKVLISAIRHIISPFYRKCIF